jgi:hypothetical protein
VGLARGLRRTGWSANFMSYDSKKSVCYQEKYIVGGLLVRTDWEVVGGARVTPGRRWESHRTEATETLTEYPSPKSLILRAESRHRCLTKLQVSALAQPSHAHLKMAAT